MINAKEATTIAVGAREQIASVIDPIANEILADIEKSIQDSAKKGEFFVNYPLKQTMQRIINPTQWKIVWSPIQDKILTTITNCGFDYRTLRPEFDIRIEWNPPKER